MILAEVQYRSSNFLGALASSLDLGDFGSFIVNVLRRARR